MAVTRRSRTIAAAPEAVWELIADPHHLPRWWPGLARVEAVGEGGFTQVMLTRHGRAVRAEFRIAAPDPGRELRWSQVLAGSPYESVLRSSEIAFRLEPAEDQTRVTIEHRQRLRGWSRTGGWLLRRATRARLDQALGGLADAAS